MVTDGTSESIVKIHVHISFHKGWTWIHSWTRVLSHYNFVTVSGFAHVSASTGPIAELDSCEGRGPEVAWRVSDWSTSVGCWDCLHVLDPDRLSAERWVAVLFVCSLCVALVRVWDPRRVPETQWRCSCMWQWRVSGLSWRSQTMMNWCLMSSDWCQLTY